jgi:hypothetical protein
VVGQHHGAARHEAVDQLLGLPHLSPAAGAETGERREEGVGSLPLGGGWWRGSGDGGSGS